MDAAGRGVLGQQVNGTQTQWGGLSRAEGRGLSLVAGACLDRARAKTRRSSEGTSPTGTGAGLSGAVASSETGWVGLIGAVASGETGLVDLIDSVASGRTCTSGGAG
eukprot:scaffold38834_cov33-Attheya_sp.AAC.1